MHSQPSNRYTYDRFGHILPEPNLYTNFACNWGRWARANGFSSIGHVKNATGFTMFKNVRQAFRGNARFGHKAMTQQFYLKLFGYTFREMCEIEDLAFPFAAPEVATSPFGKWSSKKLEVRARALARRERSLAKRSNVL